MATVITNVTELQNMANDLAGDYELGNDIDASATVGWNGGEGFEPVGHWASAAFTGSLNGMGYTISNLTINRTAASWTSDLQGLFGWVDGATITNVNLAAVSITGRYYVGALIGSDETGTETVINCTSSGNVTGTRYVGGLAGVSLGTVSGCSSACIVAASEHGIGGLAGDALNATISDSYATGSVSSPTSYNVGGFAGNVQGSTAITDCYATGAVSARYNVGGFMGAIRNTATVTQCYASGMVSGGSISASSVGGFVGHIQNTAHITKSFATGNVTAEGTGTTTGHGGFAGHGWGGTIEDCYSRGNVTITTPTGTDNCGGFLGYNNDALSGKVTVLYSYSTGAPSAVVVGGFVGKDDDGSYTACKWDTTTSGTSTACGDGTVTGVTGYTTTQLKSMDTIISNGWNTATIWTVATDINNGYPCLKWQVPVVPRQPEIIGDRTIINEKPVLELIRNLEVQLDGRFYVSKSGIAVYESRYSR